MTTAAETRPVEDLVVGVLGGTGPQGRGLAVRLAAVGQRVLLGSRDADRAREVAEEVAGRAATVSGGEVSVQGGSNLDVAGAADLVIVAVPYAGHAATLAELAAPLAGKVVVDCVVPMGFDELGAHVLDVEEGSVTQQAAALLPDSDVVGAFHHLSARLLEDLSQPTIDGDVMVVGDVRAATDTVQALAGRLPGMRGIYAGRLRNARQVEALTINLVSVNRRYKAHAGIRVTDV
ncbi:NADPH-dependent F420 reductase [Geodermatophilus aquaeductus]|uniref:Reduced coenzyme F420:NADP oxidoreductase n=1 Tax=Geodermatophilus aquaeductus TaxID=1564161 RepID=A0A521DNX7_9ACTN|nr:NADPH-dependent F420 reductase [Geodermatophilus aquaeductus]SMO73437.1 reduced coenzyme F420:NADP oxidoreductase [Geodermatophilus aquaeductus]